MNGRTSTIAAPRTGGQTRPFFADRLEGFGDRTAAIAGSGESLSYRELARRADDFAASLSGSRKLLLVEAVNQLPPLVAYLGALRARHPVILAADGATSKDRRILDTFQPQGVFRCRDGDWGLELQSESSEVELHEDLALLLSTSGSTGSPKLVRLSHESLGANAESIVEYLRLDDTERAITTLPFHYSYGLSVVHSHLAVGATLLLTDASVTSPELWELFRTHGGTSFAGVPHTFELLDRSGFRDEAWPTLRTITQAGGRMPPEMVLAYSRWARERGVRFYVMYGQTEAGPRMAYVPPELLDENADCIGQPVPGGSFEIRDESGNEVIEPGEVGELVYRGPNVMLGYALTRGDLARGREVSELFTGDLACRNHRGLVRIAGRKSRFSKLAGLRLGHDEVEAFLGRNGISTVVSGDDRRLVVCTREPGTAARIQDLLRREYGLGGTAFSVLEKDEYPVLPSGKVDYRALLREAAEAPERQESLRGAYRRILHAPVVRDSDSFVTLGGDSLNYVQVSLAIEAELGHLPRSWELTPIGELERLGKRHGALPALPTEVVVRVASILGVLLVHATNLRFPGGSDVLLILAGCSFACYQSARLHAGATGSVILQYLRKVMLPCYLITLTYLLATQGELGLKRLFWIATAYYHPGQIEHLWFLQVLFHAVILYSILFMIPAFRRWAKARPWSNGCAILAASVTLHVFASDIHMVGLYNCYTLQKLYLFAFGWCLQLSVTRRQKAALMGLAVLLVCTYLPDVIELSRFVWVLVATALMLWTDRIIIPRRLHGPLTLLARSSFYIYLLQVIPIDLVGPATEHVWQVPLLVAEAIALGIAAWWVVGILDRRLPWPQAGASLASIAATRSARSP